MVGLTRNACAPARDRSRLPCVWWMRPKLTGDALPKLVGVGCFYTGDRWWPVAVMLTAAVGAWIKETRA